MEEKRGVFTNKTARFQIYKVRIHQSFNLVTIVVLIGHHELSDGGQRKLKTVKTKKYKSEHFKWRNDEAITNFSSFNFTGNKETEEAF